MDGLTGLVEFGESPLQAARREVFEESGLIVEVCKHRGHLLLYNTESLFAISADQFVAWGIGESSRGAKKERINPHYISRSMTARLVYRYNEGRSCKRSCQSTG